MYHNEHPVVSVFMYSKPCNAINRNNHQDTFKTNQLEGFRGTAIYVATLCSKSQPTHSNLNWDLDLPVKIFQKSMGHDVVSKPVEHVSSICFYRFQALQILRTSTATRILLLVES